MTNPQNSNNQNSSKNDSDTNFITAIINFISDSTESSKKFRRTSMYFGIIFLFCWSLLLTIMLIMRPDKLSVGIVELEKGTLTLKNDGKKEIYMVLSPNGGTENEWVDPEIEVKKGQIITINATGKINLSLGKLIESAQDDIPVKYPWNDPNGQSYLDQDPWNPNIKQFKTMPEQPFGMLIAKIKSTDKNDKPQLTAIGKEHTFEAEKNGKLLLTVNDIWLSPEKEEAYLPPIKDARNYYSNKVVRNIDKKTTITEEKTQKLDEQKLKQEINKVFNTRQKKWREILKNKNYSLWYDDNVGSFSVTISIE